LETTGKRYNDLCKLWRRAESGEIEFISLFLMWSHDPAYKTAIPDDFKLTAETSLAELHGAAGAARHLVTYQCKGAYDRRQATRADEIRAMEFVHEQVATGPQAARADDRRYVLVSKDRPDTHYRF
jgi:hypothetical protein